MTASVTFADLAFNPRGPAGNVQARHTFANGYTASVVRGPYTYGGDRGLYELAVMDGSRLVYDTPVTEDVEGYLSEDAVTALLAQIEALPARTVSA